MRVCVKNVNLCASKIGLQNEAGLSNELFKCRNKKKREQSFLEQKHSEIKKKDKKNSPWKKKKRRAKKHHRLNRPNTLLVCVRACPYVCNRSLCLCVCNDDDRCLTVISHRQTSFILARPAVCVCVGPTARKSCGGSKEDKVEPSRLRRATAAGPRHLEGKIPDYDTTLE